MRTVVIKKVTNAAITILIILVANFVLFRMLPGNPADTFFRTSAGHSVDPELKVKQTEIFGLNDPLHIQIEKYIVNTFTGNWGYSFFQGDSLVTDIIAEKAVWTLLLVGTSTVLTIWTGILIGASAAWRRGKSFDLATLGVGFFFYAMPTFWFGLILVILFHQKLGIFPLLPADHPFSIPPSTDPWIYFLDVVKHLILPALTLTVGSVVGISLIMRNSLIDVLTEDYIVTARAKGLSNRAVLKSHAKPNARLPMVTVIALNLGFVLGGAFQVEYVFSYDGLGSLTIKAVSDGDYPLLQALFLLITIGVVVANLVSDFLYAWLDPRVRLE